MAKDRLSLIQDGTEEKVNGDAKPLDLDAARKALEAEEQGHTDAFLREVNEASKRHRRTILAVPKFIPTGNGFTIGAELSVQIVK